MIERSEALEMVRQRIPNPAMVRHCLAVEAVMRALAVRLGADPELWARTGLLHDLDTELTINDFPRHGFLAGEWLSGLLPEDALHAICVHPGHLEPISTFDKALFCADPVTGLIIATVLVIPSHRLADVKTSSLRKKFKDKSFAAGVNRERVASCSGLGIELDRFLELALGAMQEASAELGF